MNALTIDLTCLPISKALFICVHRLNLFEVSFFGNLIILLHGKNRCYFAKVRYHDDTMMSEMPVTLCTLQFQITYGSKTKRNSEKSQYHK